VIGLAAAYECALRGHSVTVVDRAPAERDGCSFGNAGMVVPSHFIPLAAPGMVALGLKWMWNPESPFYIQPRLDLDLAEWGLRFCLAATAERVRAAAPLIRDLSWMGREGFERWQSAGLEFGLTQRGLLMLCKSSAAMVHEAGTAALGRELGIPSELLDAEGVAALLPGVRCSVVGGVYFPKDCHLVPERLLAALQQGVIKLGGELIWETEVTGWETAKGRVVAAETQQRCHGPGRIAADAFVLAGGSWSLEVARRELGLRLLMQAGKGYSVTVQRPPVLPGICAILTEARVAVTPMGDALRFGGTMEIAGLRPGVNMARVRGIARAVPDYLPDFGPEDFAAAEPWYGFRPCSPDGLPYMGKTRRWENLVVATGHAMMGVSLAPATGSVVADLVSGTNPGLDREGLRLLSPDRY
jgi:D-amino-acid dehydrogenase